MTTTTRWLAVILLSTLSSTAMAQGGTIAPCPPTIPIFPPPALLISPSAPLSGQPITITAIGSYGTGKSVTAQVVGSTIAVTLAIEYQGFGVPPPQPPVCGFVTVGPLTPGMYIVDYYTSWNGTPPMLQASTNLVVALDPSAIPTISDAGIAALALLLSVAGWLALRRKV